MNTTGRRAAGCGEFEARGNVRRARPDDARAMAALEKQAPELAHWSEEAYRAAFESVRPERIMLVSEARGALESFLVARFAGLECELESLLVRPESRRRGIATRLLDALV
ncbi:MAG: GNAT family N-acetyltransferase, partial [Acidobacteria bacterium]|nr:GNAT family N-acetyltransferase [Acidobacteriota bacterium]